MQKLIKIISIILIAFSLIGCNGSESIKKIKEKNKIQKNKKIDLNLEIDLEKNIGNYKYNFVSIDNINLKNLEKLNKI